MPRKDGTVTKSFTYEGKRYYVTGSSEIDAEVKKVLKLRDLEEGKVELSKDMLFSKWAEICIDTYKTNCSEKRRKVYHSMVRNNINPIIGDKKMRFVTNLDCQRVLNLCCFESGDSKSRYTVKQTKYLLNFIFTCAKSNRIVIDNPAENIALPNTPAPKKGRSLTPEERQAFMHLSAKTDRFRLFELMYYCGCRPDEAAGVTGSDIFEIRGHHMLHIRGTKTHNSDRTVPIPDALYVKICDTHPDEYVAPNTIGRRHGESSYKRLVKALRRNMNIELGCKIYRNELIPPFPLSEDFIPYYFRHTFCTNLQKSGIDIRTAQALMGHADITTTANIYTHSDEELLIAAAQAINKGPRKVIRKRLKKA